MASSGLPLSPGDACPMKLRFYTALAFGVVVMAVAFYDLYIEPNGNALRASAGILLGLFILAVAVVSALLSRDKDDVDA